MTEQELRALVRDAIARHGGAGQKGALPLPPPRVLRNHASHAMFVLSTGSDEDGPCVIEPAVTCNHCGYCRSYGH
jgi:hypothetical protein